jgi:hypothetical protein
MCACRCTDLVKTGTFDRPTISIHLQDLNIKKNNCLLSLFFKATVCMLRELTRCATVVSERTPCTLL